jgi:hypothetical protein
VPFRLDEFRAKVQFTTSADMPMLVYEACVKTGVPSNTVYYQLATCVALSRDLGLDYDDLVAALPPPRGPSAHLFDPSDVNHPMSRFWRSVAIGPANTIEEVR